MENKIRTLFAFRHLPEFLGWSGTTDPESLMGGLETLQASIYALDQYLEQNWELDDSALHNLWDDIHRQLAGLGVSPKETPYITRNLKKYEILERGLRHGHLLSRMPIRNAYVIKSCDVKLIRQLVFRMFPDLAETHKPADWILFDLFTEVHDDISDVEEDAQTYNGNRFMISCFEIGFEETYSAYDRFILQLSHEIPGLSKPGSSREMEWIHAWTGEAHDQARKLLETTTQRLSDMDFSDIALAKMFSQPA